MIDPLNALLVAAAVAAAAGLLLRPQRGLFWRWLDTRRRSGRVLLEDALKHLYDFEYQQRAATVQSLAGALSIPGNRAAELLARLETLRLLRSESGAFKLTRNGRGYALRVIRLHRLWERHLSEETGLNETEWHREAERLEHVLSPAEADELAERMGHPLYDPHGDPIPTAAGEIAPGKGRPLTDLPPGQLATIVHLEDEPEALYAQLMAVGLHPGMLVRVEDSTAERIRFWADGEEQVLAPVVAANVSVFAQPEVQEMEGPFEALSSLRPGQKGAVLSLSRACQSAERRRLMDLGLVPGTVVKAEMAGPGGALTAYRIRGALIALRKEQADLIRLQPKKNGA